MHKLYNPVQKYGSSGIKTTLHQCPIDQNERLERSFSLFSNIYFSAVITITKGVRTHTVHWFGIFFLNS